MILFIFNFIELERARTDPTYCLRVINPEARAALEGLYEEYKAPVRYLLCPLRETICPLIILIVVHLSRKKKKKPRPN